MTKKLFDPKDGEFAKNIRSLEGDDPADLRESMRVFGWKKEFPALIDENGVVLVGHRRLKIAKELNITPVRKYLKIGKGDEADAERFRLAVASNTGGRLMTLDDRKHIAERLYGAYNWTMERIAAALGVSKQTISTDLVNCQATGQLKSPMKTDTNPKGAGRPKGATSTPKTTPKAKKPGEVQKQRSVDAAPEEWEEFKKKAEAEGKSAAAKLGEFIKQPDVERSDLPLTLQEKFDAAVKKYERGFESRLRSEVNKEVERWGEAILPTLKKELDDARAIDEALRSKGIMDRNTYNSIRRCLHPDSRLSLSEEILAKAFDKFKELERYLLSAKDAPGSFTELPENFEEWSKMRRKGTAGRKTKGKNSVVRR